MKFYIKAAALIMLTVSLTFSACGGGGDTGGGDSETPASTLFANKSYLAPGAICPAGGIQIDMGFDNSKNNVLDADEITKTEYVCNGEDASSHPFVVYTSPTPNETDVELDTVISAVFNTEMDESTITGQTFTVKDSSGNSVAGTVSYSGIVAVFTPAAPLNINMKYTVNLSSTIENENEIAMGYDHKIYFTGGKAAVIYKANGATGGDVPVDETRYVAGGKVNASANTGSLVKAGYSFSGWNTEADGSGTPYTVNAQINITTTSVILYAMWTTAYTVTYDANGGSGTLPTDSNLYTYGQDFTVKTNIDLVNGGLHFAGWSKNADGSGYSYTENTEFQMDNENVTLYAKWIPYAPANVVGTCNSSSEVDISWTAVSGATSYNIYWCNTSGAGMGGSKITGVASPFKHTELSSGTEYYYIVTAVCHSGESVASDEVYQITYLTAPSVTASPINNTTVQLSWTSASGICTPDAFKIYKSTNSGLLGDIYATLGMDITSLTVSGLTSGVTYYFTVTVTSAYGLTSASVPVSVKVP